MNHLKTTVYSLLLALTFSFSSNCLSILGDQSEQVDPLVKSYRYETNKEYNLAIQQMLKVKNKGHFYSLRLGWLFYLNKQYRNSLNFYQSAIEVMPKSVNAHLGLYNSHMALGSIEDALNALTTVNDLKMKNLAISKRLLYLYRQKKQNTKGLKLAEETYQLFPDDLTILEYLTVFCQLLNKTESARKYAKEILAMSPANPFAQGIISITNTTLKEKESP